VTGRHATPPSKLARYQATGASLPPVRFWAVKQSAMAWAARCGRSIVLEIEVDEARSYPLPDHKPRGHAYWFDGAVRSWVIGKPPHQMANPK